MSGSEGETFKLGGAGAKAYEPPKKELPVGWLALGAFVVLGLVIGSFTNWYGLTGFHSPGAPPPPSQVEQVTPPAETEVVKVDEEKTSQDVDAKFAEMEQKMKDMETANAELQKQLEEAKAVPPPLAGGQTPAFTPDNLPAGWRKVTPSNPAKPGADVISYQTEKAVGQSRPKDAKAVPGTTDEWYIFRNGECKLVYPTPEPSMTAQNFHQQGCKT